MVLEDLQLTFFAWNPKLFLEGSGYQVIQYIFNPVFWLIENGTIALYAISFAIFAALAILTLVCTVGLVKARLKATWPLSFLRTLLWLACSFQLSSILLAFAQPLVCVNGAVHGFAGLSCGSDGRIALLAASGVGAALLVGYAAIMSLLYNQTSPSSKTGKTTGRVGLVYVCVKLVLVLIRVLVDVKVASIVTSILIGGLTAVMLITQPYFESTLNRVRFGMFFSSWIVSICSIGAAFADLSAQSTTSSLAYTAVTIAAGLIAIPAGYYLCTYFTKTTLDSIYGRMQMELELQKEAKLGDVRIHRSQLDLIYSNMTEVINVKAKTHEVSVYPDEYWCEHAARFVRESYLDGKAATLALQIFEIAFEQFPKSAHVRTFLIMRPLIPDRYIWPTLSTSKSTSRKSSTTK